MTGGRDRASHAPGWVLLHPAPAAAVLLIVVNDLWVKPNWPGLVAGKLSDIGICFLLPVVVYAALDWARRISCLVAGRPFDHAGGAAVVAGCVVTTLYFGAMQISTAFAEAHETMIHAVIPWRGRPDVRADLTDLYTLAMVPVAWLYLRGSRAMGETAQRGSRGRDVG